jgi:hypothetical protein
MNGADELVLGLEGRFRGIIRCIIRCRKGDGSGVKARKSDVNKECECK